MPTARWNTVFSLNLRFLKGVRFRSWGCLFKTATTAPVIVEVGVGDANALAGGISQALITTAAGLTVAIPSFFFYRLLTGRVAEFRITMEQQAIALLEAIEQGGSTQGGNH